MNGQDEAEPLLGRSARSHSQPRGGSGRRCPPGESPNRDKSSVPVPAEQSEAQVVPKAPMPKANGTNRLSMNRRNDQSTSSNSDSHPTTSTTNATAPPPPPPDVQAQQRLQAAARQGTYALLSVLHSRNPEGFSIFHEDPGWLQNVRQICEPARALLVAIDVDDPADQADLRQLVGVLRASELEGKPIFAVPLSIDNANLIQEKRQQVAEVLSSGVDDFFSFIDARFFQTIEVALMRIGIQSTRQRRRMNELQQELEDAKNQIDYIQWHWIPSQLRLTAIPRIDPDLEEAQDGSIAELQFIRNLGSGAFGTVHEARTPSGQTLAVKVMRKDNAPTVREVERIYREVQILSSLPHHQNLARLHFVLHSPDTLYICLAYGGPQNLYHLQLRQPHQAFALNTARELFGQIAGAVGHMHRNLFYHRDVKPENVAVNGNEERGFQAMLVDCGLAVMSERPLRQMCGSLPFAAPEILDDPCQYYGGPADAFAVGMLLFELVRGQSAMENQLGWTRHTEPSPYRARQLRTLLVNGPPNVNRDRNEPHELTPLLYGLLHVDPSRRMNLVEVLRSPWLSTTSSESRMPAPQP